MLFDQLSQTQPIVGTLILHKKSSNTARARITNSCVHVSKQKNRSFLLFSSRLAASHSTCAINQLDVHSAFGEHVVKRNLPEDKSDSKQLQSSSALQIGHKNLVPSIFFQQFLTSLKTRAHIQKNQTSSQRL